MKRAGIKVWVLTGDKIETAMNIGVSAGLLDNYMAQHIIEDADEQGLRRRLDIVHFKITHPAISAQKQAIIVAGSSLITMGKSDIES